MVNPAATVFVVTISLNSRREASKFISNSNAMIPRFAILLTFTGTVMVEPLTPSNDPIVA